MSGNTFGRLFRLTTYGESHGPGLGGIVDGCPAGLPLSEADVQQELDARRPGREGPGGAASTPRNEPDKVRILSGVYNGVTTGTPIAFHVDNTDQRSGDYAALEDVFRPGHADLTFHAKFGLRDPRGGGRSSGRETLSRVAGGAIAQRLLSSLGMRVRAYTLEFGGLAAPLTDPENAGTRPFFSPDSGIVSAWEEHAANSRAQGDTLGGLVRVEVHGLPAGLGEPVFDKLDARLAYALMGVGAVKGVEIGDGFASARLTGGANNDPILPDAPDRESDSYIAAPHPLPGDIRYGFLGNRAGGVLGGISSGAPLTATVAVKPIASIAKEQQTISAAGEKRTLRVGGRHDISAIPRIVPVLKAMAALTVADFLLLQQARGPL